MSTLEQVRRYAMSLREVTEQPHFDCTSFRVRGKIFVTVPPDGQHLHVFLDEEQRALALAVQPACVEALWRGGKVVGLRVNLSEADVKAVNEPMRLAWMRKAPKSLLRG